MIAKRRSPSNKLPIAVRFWSHVDRTPGQGPQGECWQWDLKPDKEGYGVFKVEGDRHVQAHRFGWFLLHGPIPGGVKICHRCDNPPCCRDEHLFPGTQRDNVLDAVAKGRLNNFKKGAEHYNARKTHCVNGHEFTPENTIQRTTAGWRDCRTCARINGRGATARYRARKLEDPEKGVDARES